MSTPFVRTDFSDDAAWRAVVDGVGRENEHGFLADVAIVDDRANDGADAPSLLRPASAHAVLFVADAEAVKGAGHPILCVDTKAPHRAFRCVLTELWGVENNLAVANMDFDEFADAADADGVFRGFG